MLATTRAIISALATGLLLAGGAVAATPDPTRPPTAEEIRAWRGQGDGQPTAWRLESVLISDRRRVAVINGHAVSAGGTVDDARVTAIEPGSVKLKIDGKTVELTLEGQDRSDNRRQDR